MSQMKDRLYLFSLMRGGAASLVASLSDERDHKPGENFFSKVGIDFYQLDRMMSILEDDSMERAFALKGRSHIYLIFGIFSYETGLFIAVEPRVPVNVMKYLLDIGLLGNINICFEDDFAPNDVDESDVKALGEEYDSFCEMASYLDTVARFENESDRLTAEDVERNITKLAEFIGLSVNYSINHEAAAERSGIMLASGFCAVAFLLMAVAAYKYSANKTLCVETKCHGSVMAFRLSFVPESGGKWKSILESLRLMAVRCHDIYFSYRETEENDGSALLTLEFLPFYEDAGLLGVKKGTLWLEDPRLEHFKDFFILNGISNDKINNNEQ